VVTAGYNHAIAGGVELWRVVRIDAPNAWEVVVTPEESRPMPVVAALSPDEDRLALNSQWGERELTLVDLDSGDYRALPIGVSGTICRMAWLDSDRILGAEYFGGCDNSLEQPGAAYIFDLVSGVSTRVGSDGDGVYCVLPGP
jgi:hypothetical protein